MMILELLDMYPEKKDEARERQRQGVLLTAREMRARRRRQRRAEDTFLEIARSRLC